MKRNNIQIILSLSVLFILGCNNIESQSSNSTDYMNDQFNKYWYSGSAELTRYKLDQGRYGEVHEGDAVLIFVTEEFRSDTQVKYEGGDRKNVVPILKLNFTKKFLTGVYPYSLMTSIFSPVNVNDKTIKVSTSVQEWCGHAFTQVNKKGNDYTSKSYSYFQSEGDTDVSLKDALLEDALWTTIRLNPDALPQGDIDIYPGTQFLRLKHAPNKIQKATAKINSHKDMSLSDKSLSQYVLEYKNIARKLTITYEADFPHNILAWEETSPNVIDGSSVTTRAVRTHQIKSPYWGKHNNEDRALRKELGLN